jgi:hypothetical protein
MADGTEVDVHLDRDFNVIGSNSDNDEDDADVEDTSN